MENEICLNPQTKVAYDKNMKLHYEFDGYDILPEDAEKLKRMLGKDGLE